jgi:diguanylate cyclase (GGDEF)-like protein
VNDPIEYTQFHQLFSNGMMLTVYGALLVYLILTVIKIAANWKSVRLPAYMLFFLTNTLLWNIFSVLRFTSDNPSYIYILSFLPFVFTSFNLVILLFFTMRFYNQNSFLSSAFVIAILVYPVMTVVNIVLGYREVFGTGFGINLIRRDPEIVAGHLYYVYGEFGPWNTILAFLGLFIIATLIAASIVQHLKLPRIYRAPSEKLMSGLIILAVAAILTLLNVIGESETLPLNIMLAATVFSTRFFYRSTLGTQGLIFLSQARNDVIQNLSQSILFLDEESNIIFKNKYASDWLAGLNHIEPSFPHLLERLTEAASEYEKLSDDEGGTDYHFESGAKKTIYNLRQRPILDKKGRQIGMYVIYSDVTENRELIRRLEVGAGRDVLTGLNNRSMMESLKRELDTLDNLPLSIVIADLNDLKVTNDVHGHQAGDIMLRVCGEALSEKCPPTAQAGRIGGDEFLILLPKTAKLEAEEVIQTLRDHLKQITDYPYSIVMAMGCGIKDAENQNISEAMEAADKAMYADKKAIKGGAEIRNMETNLI